MFLVFKISNFYIKWRELDKVKVLKIVKILRFAYKK